MTLVSLLGFAGLCLMLALIPGPDTFLILRISLNRASAGIAAAAGCGLGAVMWGVLVGLGLAALLEQSAEVFRVVKIAGGMYLMYLGVSALLKARKARKAGTVEGSTGQAPSRSATVAPLAPVRCPRCSTPRSACFTWPLCPNSSRGAATPWAWP